MKRELRRWEIVGFIATGLFGTLLHFVYEWTGGNRVIAVFSAVNESTWEHMKLLFIPFLVFTVVEFIVFSEAFRNFFAVKAASILLGLVSIPALFYTLTGMFGKLPDWVNITIFFLADALLYFVSYRLLTDGALRGGAMQLIGFVLLWALLFAFVWFTYRPLHLPLFLDPVSGCYGVEKRPCRVFDRPFTVSIQIVYFAELLQNACAERLL